MFHVRMPHQSRLLTNPLFPPIDRTLTVASILLLTSLFSVAAHDFDLLRLNVVLVIELEVDILDQERPDFVTESIGVEMTLQKHCQPVLSD